MKNSRIILIRRKHVAALLLTLAVVAIFYLVSRPGLTAEARAIPIYSVQREDRAVSLTFNVEITDDDHTKQVMQTLNAYGVRATFFVTGQWVRQNEDLARRLIQSGHELQNLSNSHGQIRALPLEELKENLSACSDSIEAVSGHRPAVFRAPYGAYDDRVIRAAEAMGMRTVQWSVDSGDWRIGEAEAIIRGVLGRAYPGAIILLHTGREQTTRALPDILEGLLREEYLPIPVSELMLEPAYTITLTGRQIPA